MSTIPPWIMDSNGRMIYTLSGDDPWEPQLTPGANLAKQRGCTCSRLDNKWGEGIPVPPQIGETDWIDTEFVVTPGCPLHDTRLESSPDHQDQRQGNPDASANPVDNSHAADHFR